MCFIRTVLSLLLLFLFPLAVASGHSFSRHEGIEVELQRITDRIAIRSNRAELYLERGALLRLSGDWMAALGDYRRAEKINPALRGLDLAFATLFCELKSWRAAAGFVDDHLDRYPGDLEGVRLRAEILVGQRLHADAAHVYDQVLLLTSSPSPELYLACSSAHARSGNVSGAIAILDKALKQLGPVPSLQLYAIELDRSRGSFDTALERVATLAALSARPERWLVLRGEIEIDAGRETAARVSLEAARTSIEQLNQARRSTRAVGELAGRLESLFARLESREICNMETTQ